MDSRALMQWERDREKDDAGVRFPDWERIRST